MYISFSSHKAKSAVVLALTAYIIMWVSAAVHGSELITHEIDSKELAKNTLGISSMREFQVYLPDDYAEGNSRYPVLYWLPGWSQGLSGYQYSRPLDDAIQTGVIPPTIAVFVGGSDRFMSGILFLNSAMFGNWENFLISELIPFVDREYRTIPDMLGRGLMGFSAGGYSALILPLLHPDVWGSVGTNDAWLGVCDVASMPNGDPVDVYTRADFSVRGAIQIGAAVSPNPDVAIGFDWPRTLGIREKWDAYCPNRQKTISQHQETLGNLLEIALVVPEESSGTNRAHNLQMIQQMEAAGISVTRLDSPGDHFSFQNERFISIAEQILKAMEGAEVSVSPRQKVAALWGEIKQER